MGGRRVWFCSPVIKRAGLRFGFELELAYTMVNIENEAIEVIEF
jgi:hypothetical protein